MSGSQDKEGATDVMRRMLRLFVNDPPDSEFQGGFLTGLVLFAREGLGMGPDDETWKQANDLLEDE